MVAVVVLGQDSMRLPGRYATVRWQIGSGVTGTWMTATGKRRKGDLLTPRWCQAGRSALALCSPRTHEERQMSMPDPVISVLVASSEETEW